ncbi:MAG: 50S ribosomal protein L11 methyltransferase [Muricauda sp.]|jgi:ribosomal protein L11 methyltransferase|nr:50S ribosomal protein L11 methyltransferase [Allomuricauda sp.]MAU26258.1 50S ribosomal protein L11 methyltransferase [Allomuricauda sp.]MBC31136.1 50S ribosomal protein L11 methyltransferase [Allomuricauda sp.]|tara:strand:+ start:92 stop:928 length:837 start_codon:yes stop_codon:yes gene_type:complete
MANHTYLEFIFNVSPLQPATEILIAELSEIGFESFVETEGGLTAYIKVGDFDQDSFEAIGLFSNDGFEISYSHKKIADQNWNAEWEKNFRPIAIGNQCYVRAPFHESKNVPYELIIEPKMSFGTGHHETTHMMLEFLLQSDLKGKSVLDMGCGTGVLAILAEKLGANSIDAIDIDAWSYKNTLENVERNRCGRIQVFQGDASLLEGRSYDVILANINRNVLLRDIPVYAACLNGGAVLVMSGFYEEDIPLVAQKCGQQGLRLEKKLQTNNWVAVKYVF